MRHPVALLEVELRTPLLYINIPTGFPGAHILGDADMEVLSSPQEGSSGQGTNRSLLHHLVKRYMPPRTPPYPGKSSAKVQGFLLSFGNAE